MVIQLLKAFWRPLLGIALCIAIGVGIGSFLTQHQLTEQALAFSDKQLAFNKEKIAWQSEKLQASEQHTQQLLHAKALTDAAQQRADALSGQFAAYQQQSRSDIETLKRKLKHALDSDGDAFTGIGPNGLQLYLSALGYPTDANTRDNRVSQASRVDATNPTDAPRTGKGLPPEGLIDHASEYGGWCLQLRTQLININKFYGEKE